MNQPSALRLLTAQEIRQWSLPANGYYLAVNNPEHAARLFNRDMAYPRLVEQLQALTDSHAELEKERGSQRATHTANARALLRDLGDNV